MSNKMIKVSFPVEQFVRWKDPVNADVTHANFYVKARHLIEGLPRENINTRPQNIKQKFYQGVVRSAINNQETFHHQNNGMHLFARKIEIVKDKVVLHLGSKDGVGDGAHSYLSILEANKMVAGGLDTRINVRVVCNLDEKVQKSTCLSRNSSVANKSSTRHNYMGRYDFIKEVVKSQSYSGKINYSENNPQAKTHVKSLISLLFLFLNADQDKMEPCKEAWTSKGKIEQKFVDMMAVNSTNNDYHRLSNVATDIFGLFDYINIAIAKEHMKNAKAPKGFEFISVAKTKIGYYHLFANTHHKLSVAISVLLPIMGALKSQLILDKKTNKYKWKKGFASVQKLVDSKVPKIYEVACYHTDKTRDDNGKARPFLLGNSDVFWEKMVSVMIG
jgi:hypothetical protein